MNRLQTSVLAYRCGSHMPRVVRCATRRGDIHAVYGGLRCSTACTPYILLTGAREPQETLTSLSSQLFCLQWYWAASQRKKKAYDIWAVPGGDMNISCAVLATRRSLCLLFIPCRARRISIRWWSAAWQSSGGGGWKGRAA